MQKGSHLPKSSSIKNKDYEKQGITIQKKDSIGPLTIGLQLNQITSERNHQESSNPKTSAETCPDQKKSNHQAFSWFLEILGNNESKNEIPGIMPERIFSCDLE